MGGLTAHTLTDRLIRNVAPRAIRTADKSTDVSVLAHVWPPLADAADAGKVHELWYRRCAFRDADNASPELIKDADATIKLDIDGPCVRIVARDPRAFGK